MQKFWYHSPVRFYRTLEELEDMTNPQNTQYYGSPNNPYPLEINEYHRYLIPNYENEIGNQELELWIVGDDTIQIPCEFGFDEDKLFRVSFLYYLNITGRFEIRSLSGEIFYYSNCVTFIDSTDDKGRKYIRIATKNNFNRNLFKFEGGFDWIVTNIPAYCLGTFEIDEEITVSKSGEQASSELNDSWVEENVKYDVYLYGDNNILSFLTINSVNNVLYIDGTKRTRKEKPEFDEFSATMQIKFSNVKDENGLNVMLDENAIFNDVFRYALGNGDKSILYTYNNNENAIPTR